MLNMLRFFVMVISLTSCYAEWDLPKVTRRDPCTHEIDDKIIYVQPMCRAPQNRHPRDNEK
jgi:hypothetical protein